MAPLKVIARLRRCQSGAEFVEMALAFPLLMLVVLGIFDFGMLFQQYEVITNAAREGARIAILPPPYSASTDASARVRQYVDASFLGNFDADGGAVIVGSPQTVPMPGGACLTTIDVTVTYPHQFTFVGGIARYFGGSWGTATLRARSTMRTETSASTCP